MGDIDTLAVLIEESLAELVAAVKASPGVDRPARTLPRRAAPTAAHDERVTPMRETPRSAPTVG